MVSEYVSTTRTGMALNVSAAVTAEPYVPETLEEMVRQRTASAPSSAAAWKAAWKAPGEGAAVWGRSLLPRQRSQNSVGVS